MVLCLLSWWLDWLPHMFSVKPKKLSKNLFRTGHLLHLTLHCPLVLHFIYFSKACKLQFALFQ